LPQIPCLSNRFKVAQVIPADGGSDGATLASFAAVEVFAAAAKAAGVNNGRAMADWLKGGAKIPTLIGDVQFDARGDLVTQRFCLVPLERRAIRRRPTTIRTPHARLFRADQMRPRQIL
jgi:hypothetical protein